MTDPPQQTIDGAEATERFSATEVALILGMWVLAIAVAYGNLERGMGYAQAQFYPSVVMAAAAAIVTLLACRVDKFL